MNGRGRGTREESRKQALDSAWSMEMSKLTRDGTAEPVLQDQILRRKRGQRKNHFPCSAADHEQDWQPCPVVRAIHTNINLYTHTAVVVVVVVDSHVQRILLATEETTVTQQVSHRPIKCQSRLLSQRGTKVNGSHHGYNPLLRPTGIQIATKSYAALQAMAPTSIKTVHSSNLLTPY